MPSRLEDHVDFILSELLAGRSYVSIAQKLSKMGCQTSRPNLSIWVKRRAARIQANQRLVNPTLAPDQGSSAFSDTKGPRIGTDTGTSPKSPGEPLKTIARSASIAKKEPTDIERKMSELAAQAGKTSMPGWKK